MYQFKIKKQDDGRYRFELGDINILMEGYTFENDKHLLSNPGKAIAYCNIGDSIYGISNDPLQYNTVEAFYEAMNRQYNMLIPNTFRRSA